MKRKNLFKLAALAMAGAMMIVPIPAAAAEVDSEDAAQGTTTGDGNVEGIVNKDVFKVELPTIATDDTTFNFILDPQDLIKDTNGDAHPDATFDPNARGLYFANPKEGSDPTEYKDSSPSLTATNKGTTDVDVTLKATAKALSDSGYTIGLSDNDAFTGDKTTSVYLALVSRGQTAALSKDGATITDTLRAAPEDAYEVTYNSTDKKYEYGLTAAAQAADYTGFDSLDFNLVGACNTAADWAAAKDATPAVDVAWELERHFVPPVTDASFDITIPFKGAKPANGSITLTAPKGNTFTPAAAVYADKSKIVINDASITFKAAWLDIVKNNPANGVGTYSYTVNGKTYSFEVVDEIVTTPTSDGTTDIVISYTGAKPANGSIEITAPKGNTFTPPASVYGDKIVVTDNSITFKTTWLTTVKNNAANGPGTYSFTINGTTYSFIVE